MHLLFPQKVTMVDPTRTETKHDISIPQTHIPLPYAPSCTFKARMLSGDNMATVTVKVEGSREDGGRGQEALIRRTENRM